jgi:signal transduction histidine kinase
MSDTRMKLSVQTRMVVLGVAVGLMGGLIIYATVRSDKQASRARATLGQMDVESFRIADRFKDQLRLANDRMRRYASTADDRAWQDYLQAAEELKEWLAGEKLRLSTAREFDLLRSLNAAHVAYLRKAQDLRARMIASGESGASLAEFNDFFERARAYSDLGQDLARAHFDSRNEVLANVSGTLTQLRLMVFWLVCLLFAFGLGLAAVVYRDLIAPLRVRLAETQVIAQRNEKLASLGFLAAGVAHEIRNPLTAIKTALFLQQKKLHPDSSDQVEFQMVEREILRLEQIVNQFLRFGSPAPPEPVELAADAPLRDVQTLLSPSLARADIALIREEGNPLRIRVDAAQIKQVLINLVQNAADSIGRNGTITLRARSDYRILNDGETPVVVLEVQDTGRGIAPEVEKRLFDPFFSTKDHGTGLGLSIASRLVQMNKGSLQYRTQLNRGTTFGIVLPQIAGNGN